MASSIALPSPAKRHPKSFYESHVGFGDYIYSPMMDRWTQRRELTDGHPFLLAGWGRSPSTEQIKLWQEIDSRLYELLSKAIEAVDEPPITPLRSFLSKQLVFSRADLFISEIRINRDVHCELLFGIPMGDEIDMWPRVVFTDWHITESEWIP